MAGFMEMLSDGMEWTDRWMGSWNEPVRKASPLSQPTSLRSVLPHLQQHARMLLWFPKKIDSLPLPLSYKPPTLTSLITDGIQSMSAARSSRDAASLVVW